MNEKDPRAKRTIESLKEALKNLMLKKEDYYDISIKELCEEANINRRTFYLHFASIDEVLVLIQEEIAILFKDAARKIDYKKDCKPLVKAFFDILSNDPLYEKIFLYPFNDHLRFSIAKYFIKFNKCII